jgi:tetratricopeptide (TPR) repeat protein
MALALQCSYTVSRSVLIVACLVGLATADPFEPPSHVVAAQQHYLEGKRLFAAKQYAEAVAEFAQAVDLDPDAKFLLFDLGLARRMAGACDQAILAYRAFLDAQPPEKYAGIARIGIDKCEQALAAQHAAKPSDDKPVDQSKPSVDKPPPVDRPRQPDDAIAPPPPPRVQEPWYRDRAGNVLTVSGIGCGIAAGVLYLLARGAASDTFDAQTLPDFHDRASAASTYQTASLIVGGVGAALVVAGAVRYTTRPAATIAVAPTRGGAGFALSVPF